MYYPGLFETTSSYSALNPRSFKSDTVPSAEQHAELCSSLMDNKMISSLSPSSLGSASLSHGSPFRAPHFPSGPAHYRAQSGVSDLVPSAYTSSSSSSSAPHLPVDNLAATNLLHDQSFLEGSTPYGIGSLSAYPPYPAPYLSNSVINSALKGPTGSPYPSASSYYSPSATPYSSLYSESFISDYISRNQIDSVKSAYSASTENSSFHEHLKRLQESFQSKSPKFADGANPGPSSSSYPNSEAVSRPAAGATVVQDHVNASKPASSSATNSTRAKASADQVVPTKRDGMSHAASDLSGTSSHHRSTSSSHVAADSSQQQLRDTHSATQSSSAAITASRNTKEQPTLEPPTEHSAKTTAKSTRAATPAKGKSRKTHATDSTGSVKSNNKEQANGTPSLKQKSKRQSSTKLKRNRPDECGQREQTGHKKIKKGCKLPLEHPESDKGQSHEHKSSKQKDVSKAEGTMVKSKKNNNDKELSSEPPKGSRSTKKSSGSVRRRRFRSGLDMIRSPRKKAASKARHASSSKKEGGAKKKEPRKDLSTKDLRAESKRLIVNKSLGETLLHRSARNNRLDVVRFCLESDACDVNARDNAGYTPLHECSSRGNLQVARLLLEHSADVNASATGGIRPLHDAIENNHIELVRLLLSYGAEPYISTYSGSTPLQLCRSKAMFKFLKGFYADITTDRPVIDSCTLAWKLLSEPSDLANGFDVLADVPSDGQDCEQVFYASAQPLVDAHRLLHTAHRSFYLLQDVLRSTALSEADFMHKYPQVEISRISKLDLAKATLSEVDHSDGAEESSVIFQGSSIDEILHISPTVIT